jgi:hypothetical protein
MKTIFSLPILHNFDICPPPSNQPAFLAAPVYVCVKNTSIYILGRTGGEIFRISTAQPIDGEFFSRHKMKNWRSISVHKEYNEQ